MKCPICNLISPDSVIRCDCGHEFTKDMERLEREEKAGKLPPLDIDHLKNSAARFNGDELRKIAFTNAHERQPIAVEIAGEELSRDFLQSQSMP